MTEQIGYKVTTLDRTSSLIKASSSQIHYPKLITVKPKPDCGPLCVFTFKRYAERFVDKFGHHQNALQIIKCTYTPSQQKYIWTRSVHIKYPLSCLPVGTALADSVTCLE